MVDAWEGHQQVELLLVGRELLCDEGIVVGDTGLGLPERRQLVLQDEAGVWAQGGTEGITECGEPGSDVAGEAGEDVVRGAPGRQSLEDMTPVDAEQVGEQAADAEAGAVEDLVDAGAQGGAQAHDLVALA